MNYREFVHAVEEKLNQSMEGGVTAVCYTTVKNNGKEKTGILFEKTGINISPTIYMEEFYESYRNGKTLEQIVEEVLEFYEKIRQKESWDYSMILDFKRIEDRIVLKLINTGKNRNLLSEVPHIDILDLSLVFYILLEITDDGNAAMMISNIHMEQWNVDVPVLWKAAAKNVRRLLPAEFLTMTRAVREIMCAEGGSDRVNSQSEGRTVNLLLGMSEERDSMYVLSNQIRNYGAACAVYPHVLEMIGDIVCDDFYILPSSVHEVIIVPYSRGLPGCEMDAMVREINETQVADEEVLSDHTYIYERRSGVLRMACEERSDEMDEGGRLHVSVRVDTVLEVV